MDVRLPCLCSEATWSGELQGRYAEYSCHHLSELLRVSKVAKPSISLRAQGSWAVPGRSLTLAWLLLQRTHFSIPERSKPWPASHQQPKPRNMESRPTRENSRACSVPPRITNIRRKRTKCPLTEFSTSNNNNSNTKIPSSNPGSVCAQAGPLPSRPLLSSQGTVRQCYGGLASLLRLTLNSWFSLHHYNSDICT